MAELRRHTLMTVAATTTILVALTVAGGGALLSANLVHLAVLLEGQVEVVALLRDGLTPAQQQRVLAAVSDLPAVERAVLVGRDDALRRLQATYGMPPSLGQSLPSNPLPDSIEVRVRDAARIREVAEAARRLSGVDEVVFGAPVVDRLVAVTRAVRLAGALLAGVLAAAALLIITNTIRLTVSARRQEIEIMTLVGATPGFIRGPFLWEGALQGALAATGTSLLLGAGYAWLAARVEASLPFLPVLPPLAVLPGVLALVWGLGVAVGVGGSALGVRRYLVP
ncbi:MAG: permease-like cell division protein FtsX [Armatimonadota bacterium]|nr:permease-like cell division protein FtsX [Armatimonadota bacterium]